MAICKKPIPPTMRTPLESKDTEPLLVPLLDVNSGTSQQFMTERDLARRWRLASAKKLQADRLKGTGCAFIRIGRCVRYRLTDVEAYEAAHRHLSTSEA